MSNTLEKSGGESIEIKIVITKEDAEKLMDLAGGEEHLDQYYRR